MPLFVCVQVTTHPDSLLFSKIWKCLVSRSTVQKSQGTQHPSVLESFCKEFHNANLKSA